MSIFKLRVIRTDDRRCRILAEAYGKSSDSGEKHFDPEHFRRLIAPLKDGVVRSYATRSSDLLNPAIEGGAPAPLSWTTRKADLKASEDAGSELFDFLFERKIGDFFRDRSEDAQRADKALPIRLCVEHPALEALPWEVLYDREVKTFLSLSQFTPLTRGILADDLMSTSRPLPLRVLGMVARPGGLGPIDAEGEQRGMDRAIKDVGTENNFIFRWSTSGRIFDLEKALLSLPLRQSWNVFHFIGHGGFDKVENKGYLFVQEEDGAGPDVLYSDILRNILVRPNGPQLVILNSCEGAYSQSTQPFASMAADLLVGNVPAVIAMQYAIQDEVAKAFSYHFYGYLCAGATIEAAVASTRNKLHQKTPQWIAPVVYLRTADTALIRREEAP